MHEAGNVASLPAFFVLVLRRDTTDTTAQFFWLHDVC